MRLIYIANARIPTEKAHGVQIIKTCEALAKVGCELEVWLPDRKQLTSLADTDLFGFYGCEEIFKVKKIPTVDLFSVTAKVGGIFDVLAYLLQELSFILSILFQDYERRPVYARSLGAAIISKFCHHVPVILEVHDLPKNKFFRRIYRSILERFDGIVTVTEGLKKILSFSPEIPVTVITNAVDIPKYLSVNREEARKTLSFPVSEKIVMYTGSVIQNRGVDTFLKAAELLKDSNTTFILVGRMDNYGEAKMKEFKSKESLKHVHFVGYISPSKIYLYQKAADILVIPSGKGTYPWDNYGT